MTYESPLAYALALEGLALMRAFTGEHDQAFTQARIAEIRELLDNRELATSAVEVARVPPDEGYRIWSATYDEGPNAAFDLDEPVLTELLGRLPAGVALDAACGTGRYARVLAERGHRVIGVDGSPEMLAHARKRVPSGDFRVGDLERLPLADHEVDVIVCALALTHVPELAPVFAEFARVLRPGGHLVLSDVHPERVARGSHQTLRGSGGEPGRLVGYHHPVGTYLRGALACGFSVLRCEEPIPPVVARPGQAAAREAGPWEFWPWSLAALVPEAATAAASGVPAMLIWQFQLDG